MLFSVTIAPLLLRCHAHRLGERCVLMCSVRDDTFCMQATISALVQARSCMQLPLWQLTFKGIPVPLHVEQATCLYHMLWPSISQARHGKGVQHTFS